MSKNTPSARKIVAFTKAQIDRAHRNSPTESKMFASKAAFSRAVRFVEALHGIDPSDTPATDEVPFDLVHHLARQSAFSLNTFGPGVRTKGVVDHIRKELIEIEAAPHDVKEWIDVVILALDGAWRTGATPQQIVDALVAKQDKNEGRTWPDWRTADPERAIEHDRTGEVTHAEG